MKTCSKCKIEKDYSEFSKNKSHKDGLNSQCKTCCKEYSKKYYISNKEHYKGYYKEYYISNKEKIEEYRQANREKILEYKKEHQKKYRKANKEYYKEYNKEYCQANKEKIKEYKKEHKQANKEHYKEYYKEYVRNRRATDPLFKMMGNLRRRTSRAFKNKCYSKTSRTRDMLGVDWEVCKAHIERQFKKGMNWDNQGEWHIDHVIPLASANNEKELRKLCHYSNLQPLWAEDNLIKKDKIIECQIKLRI